jgi:hypothetical protein
MEENYATPAITVPSSDEDTLSQCCADRRSVHVPLVPFIGGDSVEGVGVIDDDCVIVQVGVGVDVTVCV